MDAFQGGLLSTIETCGKTLLDTFDNLLAFAKVNNLMSGSNKARASLSASSVRSNLQSGSVGLQSATVDLGLLTEEVLETAFAGHEFIKVYPKKSDLDTHVFPRTSSAFGEPTINTRDYTQKSEAVSIILDYSEPASSLWIFNTEPGGWRRVILNLVGNSLKYTDKGFITVQLHSTPPSEETGECQFTLTVSDTGRGMSKEFQQWQLFSPFVQEDPLVPGTGLGLSIVKQIITGMGGTVSVKSEKDVGTEIRISITMTPSARADSTSRAPSPLHTETAEYKNLRLRMLDIGRCAGDMNLDSTFAKVCSKWFGVNATFGSELENADIYVISDSMTESLLEHIQSTSPPGSNPLEGKVLIVTCRHLSSTRTRNNLGSHVPATCRVDYVCQPFGPKKIAHVLSQCSEFLEKRSSGQMPPIVVSSVNDMNAQRDSHVDSFTSSPSCANTADEYLENFSVGLQRTVDNIEASEVPLAIAVTPETPGSATTSPLSLDSLPSLSLNSSLMPMPERPKPASPSNLSVLLVDDNKINLQLLETFMKRYNHRYDTAMDGLEAFETYQAAYSSSAQPRPSRAYDYIFMDINMPKMDGLESTREIRAFERSSGLEPAMIIALTGLSSASAQQEAFASGVDLFLTKPVRLKELVKILAKT